jgi:hypothetical protein
VNVSGTAVTTTTHYSIDSKPSIALVKTAAVGGTGKVGDVITYTLL